MRATADLLGRSRIVDLAGDDDGRPFRRFAEDPVLTAIGAPDQALEYFRSLIPSLKIDPKRWGDSLRRQAFAVAKSCSQTLTERIQKAITDAIAGPKGLSDTTYSVQSLLDQAGVTPRNPQYAEMVVRTNVQDAYQTASYEQMKAVADQFPVWQYLGIRDGRQGNDHEPHFNLYYPSSVAFDTVRGKRIYNCRCSFAPITARRWAKLQAAGAEVQADW